MFSLFLFLKFIHILAAIVAVGLNVTYGIWIVRAQRAPSNTAFTLRGIKFLDDRVANPAYAVLLVSWLLMVFVLPYPITTLWIDIALVLYAALIVLGLRLAVLLLAILGLLRPSLAARNELTVPSILLIGADASAQVILTGMLQAGGVQITSISLSALV